MLTGVQKNLMAPNLVA